MIIGSDANDKILRFRHSVPRHRNDSVHQRLPLQDSPPHRHNGVHVIDDAPRVRRQHGRIDRPSRYRIDQLALRSLWILRMKLFHADALFSPGFLLKQADTVRLIIFHRQDTLCVRKQGQDHLQAIYQLFRFFQHPSVI